MTNSANASVLLYNAILASFSTQLNANVSVSPQLFAKEINISTGESVNADALNLLVVIQQLIIMTMIYVNATANPSTTETMVTKRTH